MPSNTSWSPFGSKRRPNPRREEEQTLDEKEHPHQPKFKNLHPLHISTSRAHRPPLHSLPSTRKSTIVNSFHRDAFSSRLSPYFETLPTADGEIRFGHKIALKHLRSGKFLHADKEHHLAESGTFAVTLHKWKPRDDDYWIVLPQLGQTQLMGKLIHYGRSIRLQHISTHANLHSQEAKSATPGNATPTGAGLVLPLNESDVSLLLDIRSDGNDVWIVDSFNFTSKFRTDMDNDMSPTLNHDKHGMRSSDFWHVDDIVSLRHNEAKHHLAGRPETVVDQEKGLSRVVVVNQCELGGAWRVAVPREDDLEILMTATMDETNKMERFTVEEASAADKFVTVEVLE
ncbi:hypothetical protein BC937DRAFT_93899 [Endogone sp. FLAS-F59071]|nr:hypothetical protein BC937DRAFT_93899 [Endogone sp. FLAS-F59071]|eukprot:RUS14393.1 hypothetical protein BC937DRAFT_93899 [Endogone sp. FLAS-F59071]